MLTVGSVICGYRIQRVLGSGGMGAVYLADDPALPRQVALKVLSAELSRDPDFRARFLREADTAAALEHPQIVSVYTRGHTDDGQLWIAMQYVDGTDADAALRAGTMTPHRAVHIIGEVAHPLDFAHAHHVVHRDIKPANFLLSGPPGPGERVLLGDFGIARALDDAGLTATGSVMATVAYAAPEVLSNAPIDHRVDIYSLGCTLFRLLTGHPPFPASNGAAGVMAAHLFSPPPRVTDAVPTLPAALNEVIATAMAKDPAARHPSAAALARAATAALHDTTRAMPLPPIPASQVSTYPPTVSPAPPWWQHSGPRTLTPWPPPPPPTRPPRTTPKRRRTLIGAAAAAVVLIAATVTVVAWPTDDTTATPAPDTAPPPGSSAASTTSQGLPPTDITADQLRPILLTADEISTAAHGDPVVLESDGTRLFNDADAVSATDAQCLGAWAPAQQTFYATSGDTGVAAQVLRAMNTQPWINGVTQAVIAFPAQDTAARAYLGQKGEWALCGGKTLTVTPPGQPAQSWDFAQPMPTSGVLTLAATLRGGNTTCQHGIVVRGNLLIDIRQCRPAGTDVTALVTATAAKVPRQ